MKDNSVPRVSIRTGIFSNDLEKSLLEHVHTEKQNDPFKPQIVLVGSRLLGDYLCDLILTEHKALLNTRFITFSDLLHDLEVTQAATEYQTPISHLAEPIAIIKAIEKSENNSYYAKVKHTPGFRHSLRRLFRNFDLAGHPFDELFNQFQPDPEGKWQSLGELYKNYREDMKHHQASRDELLEIADLNVLFKAAYLTDSLLVYGFYDFNPIQLRLINALALEVKMQILMPYWSVPDTQGTVFDYAKPVYNELCKIKEIRIFENSIDIRDAYCNRLFRYHPEKSGNVGAVGKLKPKINLQIFRTHGISDEIDELVCRINQLSLWEESPLEKIAVILWKPDSYLEPLRATLSRAGIPYCDLIREDLSKSASFVQLDRLLKNIAVVNLSHQEMLNLLFMHDDETAWRSIFQIIGNTDGSFKSWSKAVQRFEKSFSERNKDVNFDRNPKLHFVSKEHINSLLCFLNNLDKFNTAILELDSISSYVKIVLEMIDILQMTSSEMNTIKRTIRKISEDLLAETVIDWKNFIELVKQTVSGTPTKIGKAGTGVMLVDKMSSRGVSFDTVFLPGMVQGAIPTEPNENSVFNDFDRKTVLKNHPWDSELILPLKRRRRQEEKLLFSLAVDSARNNLTLSYSKGSPTQNGTSLPSRFLIDLCRVTEDKILSSEDIETLPYFTDVGNGNLTGNLDDSAVEKRVTSEDSFIENWIANRYSASRRHIAYTQIYSELHSQFRHNHTSLMAKKDRKLLSYQDGILDLVPALLNNSDNKIPITDLEKYASCPFRYFVQSVLKANPWKEFDYEIEVPPHIIGNIVHRTLKQLYDVLLANIEANQNNQELTFERTILEEILHSEIRRAKTQCSVPHTVWELTYNSLRNGLAAFVSDDLSQMGEFRYGSGELSISYKFKYKFPESGEVTLSGRIDRVDQTTEGKGVHIIDYKTGSVNVKPEKLKGGVSLQLPLYLKAVLDSDETFDPSISNAQYLRIFSDGSHKRYMIDGKQLEDLSDSLDRTVGIINTLIHRGFFIPSAINNDVCTYCPSATACHQSSRDKTTLDISDSNLELLRNMRDVL